MTYSSTVWPKWLSAREGATALPLLALRDPAPPGRRAAPSPRRRRARQSFTCSLRSVTETKPRRPRSVAPVKPQGLIGERPRPRVVLDGPRPVSSAAGSTSSGARAPPRSAAAPPTRAPVVGPQGGSARHGALSARATGAHARRSMGYQPWESDPTPATTEVDQSMTDVGLTTWRCSPSSFGLEAERQADELRQVQDRHVELAARLRARPAAAAGRG